MNICIIGTGFVGVVTATVLASFGNEVIGLDIDPAKIEKLKQGVVPFYEPGLSEILIEEQKNGHLHFTTSYEEAIKNAEVIMVAVGTPSAADGQADLKYVFATADSMAPFLRAGAIVVVKSTVPPGTLSTFAEHLKAKTQTAFHMASMPEFLREGTAVEDTLHPDRILIGATAPEVFAKLEELNQPFNAEILKLSPESAQMAKYTANSYLATRIAFINQIADLCEQNGADIQEVIQAIGFDKRIGGHYWYPGLGYGGSCFPKDVKELAAYSKMVGETDNLLIKMNQLNEERIVKLLNKYEQTVGGWKGKKVAVLGLSFKPNTNDLREAPSIKVIPYLLSKGAVVTGYDPKAEWPSDISYFTSTPLNLPADPSSSFTQVETVQIATQNADVIFCLIEWPEIVNYDFSQVRTAGKTQWLMDVRNQLNREKVQGWGFTYIGVGR